MELEIHVSDDDRIGLGIEDELVVPEQSRPSGRVQDDGSWKNTTNYKMSRNNRAINRRTAYSLPQNYDRSRPRVNPYSRSGNLKWVMTN